MPYNSSIINLFLSKCWKNEKISQISKSLEISIPTLKRWVTKYDTNIQNNELITTINLPKRIRTRQSDKHIRSIKDYVNNHQGCSLDDIYQNIGKEISKPTICRILKTNSITRKKFKIYIVAKDPNLIETEMRQFAQTIQKENIDNTIYYFSLFPKFFLNILNEIFEHFKYF